ncbi:hypothetical protein KAR50_02570 [Periweissella fabaria]|uniref:DUF2187 domain-containing protein n=1 Tax=Periweissella fabaria TaxID=546157 RepID=A0ABN8BH63_9LACO|nr:hypothetical protein [Periweissella fabaria]MCM0596731.1 hypothetical protein [Periweissella fabaria]CAH0416343.1 hypothetical protein WFA24289_00646 [Periweissella fabaria]
MAVEEIINDSGFNIGDFVAAKKFANFEHDFKGVVEKIYEHSLLVLVTENDPEDQATVNEYNHRAVVRMSETKVLIAAEVPEKPVDEAETTDTSAE